MSFYGAFRPFYQRSLISFFSKDFIPLNVNTEYHTALLGSGSESPKDKALLLTMVSDLKEIDEN